MPCIICSRLQGGFAKNWGGFVGVVLALSGVEAIANSTGVMKLNKGCYRRQPQRFQDFHSRHPLGHVGSLHFHRLAQPGHAMPWAA